MVPRGSNVTTVRPKIISEVAKFKRDIRASLPEIMVSGAIAIAKLLHPHLQFFHTHVPIAGNITLVPSAASGNDLEHAQQLIRCICGTVVMI
ncbi:hypothetical protein H6P81_019038 [Aristolochia fimbriata]|uniref:Uncharacterized protein n=1 Tax=Aristolochia fimbriata TaxID=158543 RepID=A0AAV7E4S6_ARIFI|nr:hypothetical protein H6P81_019038 [Aristolochia fimbriata]